VLWGGGGIDRVAVDLMERIFIFNPDKRISVSDALAHPYLRDYHDEADEVGGGGSTFEIVLLIFLSLSFALTFLLKNSKKGDQFDFFK
jgi:serine/threonine protein kinase